MEPEGMVHALKNIHRLLRPDGVLIDIHPAREAPLVEVHADGRIVVTERYIRAHGDDMVQAEEALAEIVRRGVFAEEAVRAFEFMTYASCVAELRAFFEEAGAYDTSPIIDQVAARRDAMYARVEKVRRRIGKRAEIGFREPTRMSRLVPS
jgi:SAM-dependent methyltransferase